MPSTARTSDILAEIARGRPGSESSIRQIVETLGERGFALFVALLGLPNCIPMVPPIPLVCGLLLAFVAMQMVIGRHSPWLPRRLLDKPIAQEQVARAMGKVMPYVISLERFSRPRLRFFESYLAERLVGVALLLLALGLVFAPPIIGQIPLGIAVCLIGFGLVERDGVVVAAGAVVGAFGLSLSLGFAYAVVAGIAGLIRALGVSI